MIGKSQATEMRAYSMVPLTSYNWLCSVLTTSLTIMDAEEGDGNPQHFSTFEKHDELLKLQEEFLSWDLHVDPANSTEDSIEWNHLAKMQKIVRDPVSFRHDFPTRMVAATWVSGAILSAGSISGAVCFTSH